MLSATFLLALASVAQADPPTVAQLQPQVDALPSNTPQQKFMKATLNWALGESTRETNAVYQTPPPLVLSYPTGFPYEDNHTQIGLDLRSDVNDILHPGGSNTPTQIGKAVGTSRTDIFPPIPHHTSGDHTNPIAAQVDANTSSAITNYQNPNKTKLGIGTQNEQDLAVVECFCHPSSTHFQDTSLVPVIFDFLNVTLDTPRLRPELQHREVRLQHRGGPRRPTATIPASTTRWRTNTSA